MEQVICQTRERGGTTELCYAAGKSQMAISDPYQSAKWLKVHLAKWRLASSIIHDALFSLLQGIHCSSLFYLQSVYKASLFFTLRIQIVSCNLFFVHESMKKTTFKIGIFTLMDKIFPDLPKTTQTVEFIFSNVAYRATV